MHKTQLSSNLVSEKIVTALAPPISFFIWPVLPMPLPLILFLATIIFVLYSIYNIYFVVVNVSYDAAFLFITDRKKEKIIELKSIIRIERSPYYGGWRKRWKMTYIENGVDEFLLFFPLDDSVGLVPFIKQVKDKNPSVEIADTDLTP